MHSQLRRKKSIKKQIIAIAFFYSSHVMRNTGAFLFTSEPSLMLWVRTAVLWIPHCFLDYSQWLLCSSQLKSNTILSHITTIVFTCRSIPFSCAILHNECRGF